MKCLYQVMLPYMCAGFITDSGIVIDSAPILHWTIGKNIKTVQSWVFKKSGKILLVREE